MSRREQQQALVLQALEHYGDRLMSYPNVVGVGLGEEKKENESTGRFVVKVYVSRLLKSSLLPPEQRIPAKLAIRIENNPTRVIMIPTSVEEVGEFQLETSLSITE